MPDTSISFSINTGKSMIFVSLASIPQCQVLFVGPNVCTRHDILSSMVLIKDKIAHLCLDETDVVSGDYYRHISTAIGELIGEAKAKAIILVTGCQNELIGTDYGLIEANIKSRYGIPVEFIQINRLNMYRARKGAKLISGSVIDVMCGLLKKSARARPDIPDKAVNIIGNVLPVSQENELVSLLKAAGFQVRHISSCADYAAFEKMACSSLNIVTDADAAGGAGEMERALGIPWVDMSFNVSVNDVIKQYKNLTTALGTELNIDPYVRDIEEEIMNTQRLLNGIPIQVDGRLISYPFSVAKALVEYGFRVERIITNEFIAEESAGQEWIKENAPDVSVDFISSRNQSGTSHQNRFQELLKSKRALQEPYLTGFARISCMLDALADEYIRRENLYEQVMEKTAASGA